MTDANGEFDIRKFRAQLNQENSDTHANTAYVQPVYAPPDEIQDWRQVGVQRNEGFQAPAWLIHLEAYWHRYIALGMSLLFIAFYLAPDLVPGAEKGSYLSTKPGIVILMSVLPGLLVWRALASFRKMIKSASQITKIHRRGRSYIVGAILAVSAFVYWQFFSANAELFGLPENAQQWLLLTIKTVATLEIGGRIGNWVGTKYLGVDTAEVE